MVHNIVTGLGLAVLLFGLFVFFTAVLGLYRFDYVLNRMHAAAVGDALGIFCILLGLMLLHGWSLPAFKTLAILLFLWLTSPVSSHLIAEMEVLTIPDIQKECEVEVRWSLVVAAIALRYFTDSVSMEHPLIDSKNLSSLYPSAAEASFIGNSRTVLA